MPTATWSEEPQAAVTDTLTLRITFDEPITGFAAGDLRLRRISDRRMYTPSAAKTTLTHLGSNVWEVKIVDLASLLGEQNTQFLVRMRWHTVFFETSQQTGPLAAADSARFTVHTTVPFGVIGAFAHQRITIGTEMALDIRITGNPDHAYIEGLLEGFYTNWNDPTLEVRGVATRLISNRQFTVKALKESKEPLMRTGVFSVVPAAPVITNPGKQKLVRGIENGFNVKISNTPSLIHVVGPWVGMRYAAEPDGIRIFGIVPEVSHAIPSDQQKFRVTAETGDLTDEVEIGFDLLSKFIYGNPNSDDFYRLQLNDSDQSVSSDLDFATDHGQIRYIASDEDYIYYGSIDSTSKGGVIPHRAVYRVPINTGDGQSVSGTLVRNFHVNGSGIVIDGNTGYRAEGPSRIRVFNKSDGSTIRSFRINVSWYLRGLAIDGDDLIVLIVRTNVTGQHLRWYDKNTLNNRTANHTREVRLPNTNKQYEDIAVFDGKIFVTNQTSKTITLIDIETGNVLATYTLPSSLRGMYGITVVAK